MERDLCGVSFKDLEVRGRTFMATLSSCVEPWAPPHAVFYGLRLLFAKGTQ